MLSESLPLNVCCAQTGITIATTSGAAQMRTLFISLPAPPAPPALPALSAFARSTFARELRRDLAVAAYGRVGGPAPTRSRRAFQQCHRARMGQLDGSLEPERIGAGRRRRSASTGR